MSQEWKVTACPHDCPGGCILEARYEKSSDTLITRRLEGNVGLGGFCAKGHRWFGRRNDPRRITTPLLRGEEGFHAISWRRAWDIWAHALEEGLHRVGPLGNALYQSAGSLYFSKNLLSSVHAALGGYTTSMGNLCSSAGNQGLRNCFGQVPVQPLDVLERNGKSILFWGRNFLENHSSLVPLARELRRRGGSMGVLEIRNTPSVSWCDRQWFLTPGGDCFLAAWLCKHLLREGRASSMWTEKAENPDEFEAFLENLDEKNLLERSGISRKDAVSLYDWLLESAPVTHYMGYGIQRYSHGEMQAWWIGALAVLLGALELPGRGLVFGKDEMALFPSSLLKEPAAKRSFPEAQFWSSLEKASPSVHTLGIFCANPVKQAPQGNEVARIIRDLPFSVCVDFILTETARCCSLVLPSRLFFEEGPDWRGSYGHSLLCRTEKITPSPGECLGDVDILEGLRKTLDLSLSPWELRNQMDLILRNSRDMEKIHASVYAWKEPNFWDAPSSSAKLPVRLPFLRSLEESQSFFEFRLVTYHVGQYINGQNWDLPEETILPVFLSPEEARRIGVSAGERVRLWNSRNPRGIFAEVWLDPHMGSGYCAVPQGSPSINTLTAPLVSPGYGVPFSESLVQLAKE